MTLDRPLMIVGILLSTSTAPLSDIDATTTPSPHPKPAPELRRPQSYLARDDSDRRNARGPAAPG
jgi:hypothetical protein